MARRAALRSSFCSFRDFHQRIRSYLLRNIPELLSPIFPSALIASRVKSCSFLLSCCLSRKSIRGFASPAPISGKLENACSASFLISPSLSSRKVYKAAAAFFPPMLISPWITSCRIRISLCWATLLRKVIAWSVLLSLRMLTILRTKYQRISERCLTNKRPGFCRYL